MGRMAWILTKGDVPKYVRKIAKRLKPIMYNYSDEEGSWWGYVFRLDAKWKVGYESQLQSDAERLVKWANGWHAHAKVVKYVWWTDVGNPRDGERLGMSQRRKAWKSGFRNHAIIVLSDPVAYRFEKDGNYIKED